MRSQYEKLVHLLVLDGRGRDPNIERFYSKGDYAKVTAFIRSSFLE